MSLHLSFSTHNPDADRFFGGCQSAVMSVEFLFEGWYSSIEQHTEEIGNYLNKDARSFLDVDSQAGRDRVFPQLDTHSGRYRQKHAVPT
ncbi:MAG TPA: hypothetical protein V6D14_14770 [Coleofasciculaceae cyanobacterium]